MTADQEVEFSLIELDLSDRARSSTRAILWIRPDIEFGHGHEITCTVRPREPFRPERLAVLASCAGAFDLVDLKFALCSAFAHAWSGADVPAVQYAAAYELRPRPVEDAWVSGPHRVVVPGKERLGQQINGRVCPVEHDVSITVRHRQGAVPSLFEAIILGEVMSVEAGRRYYLKEQQALEEAFRRHQHR